MVDLGEVDGHRLVLLSLEVYDEFADLRFARIDEGATTKLERRVPPADAWHIEIDGEPATVIDSVGRGDRSFSNGEVRIAPAPTANAQLTVAVRLRPDTEPLTGTAGASPNIRPPGSQD